MIHAEIFKTVSWDVKKERNANSIDNKSHFELLVYK